MNKHKPLSLLIIFILTIFMAQTAFAHDVPNTTRKGSINITMSYGQESVGGSNLTLYRVGEVYEDDGNYSFQACGDFADYAGSLEDIHSSRLALDLANYAQVDAFPGVIKEISSDGTVFFTDLDIGLYLLVQTDAANGCCAINPFLVSVPKIENEIYVYDVDASPKVELVPDTSVPPNDTPDTPTDPSLPQTGQLNWPIPLLAASGLALFFTGWILRFGRKKEKHEK